MLGLGYPEDLLRMANRSAFFALVDMFAWKMLLAVQDIVSVGGGIG